MILCKYHHGLVRINTGKVGLPADVEPPKTEESGSVTHTARPSTYHQTVQVSYRQMSFFPATHNSRLERPAGGDSVSTDPGLMSVSLGCTLVHCHAENPSIP